MRILRGKLAGRTLTSPGRPVRPSAEEVRDHALTLVAEELPGARFLDLFAGTGAVGLEAWSRGAAAVDLVENGAGALHALKANVAALGARNRCRIFKKDVSPWIDAVPAGAYDIAYVDPPYGSMKLDRVLARWSAVPFARIVIVEHHPDHRLELSGRSHDLPGPTRLTILSAPSGLSMEGKRP